MLKIHDLPMALGGAFRLLHRCTDACCKKYGITAKQFVLLVLLAEEDGITQQELVKRAASDQNTIRAMLILLEKLGMIKREQHVTDGRKHHITITQKGLKTYKNALKDSEVIREHMYANFSIDELKAFQAFLNRIIVTLEDFSLKHNNITDD
jgi:DNA-binding MarR family transcriptional regulator